MPDNKRFKQIRGTLSRKEFAKKLEVSYELVSKIETGAKPLSRTLALKISSMFGVSVDWLYDIDAVKEVVEDNTKPNIELSNDYVPMQKYLQILEENSRLKDQLLEKQKAELDKAKNIEDVSK